MMLCVSGVNSVMLVVRTFDVRVCGLVQVVRRVYRIEGGNT